VSSSNASAKRSSPWGSGPEKTTEAVLDPPLSRLTNFTNFVSEFINFVLNALFAGYNVRINGDEIAKFARALEDLVSFDPCAEQTLLHQTMLSSTAI
jgi:hypothetical protein